MKNRLFLFIILLFTTQSWICAQEAVTIDEITAQTTKKYSINLLVTYGGNVTDVADFGLYYALTETGLSAEGCRSVSKNSCSSDNSVSFDLTGLEAETTYFIKPFVVLKSDNNTIWGEVTTFTTKEKYPMAEPVDLGISIQWASWNIGAENEYDYGSYMAWGDFTAENTSFVNTDYPNVSDISGTEYDVALQKWGKGWRMPTAEELLELGGLEKELVEINGVKGVRIYGTNGREANSIFVPFSGIEYETGLDYVNGYGYYWASNNITIDYAKSCMFGIVSNTIYNSFGKGKIHLPVRAVYGEKVNPNYDPTNDVTPVELTEAGKKAVAVDMGLSVKWASYNLGATAETQTGEYFAWGETTSKDSYTNSTYTNDPGKESIQASDIYDAARAQWGGKWRIPTMEQFEELCDENNCYWIWEENRGGYIVKSKITGNSIFFYAAGRKLDTTTYWESTSGQYISASYNEDPVHNVPGKEDNWIYILRFDSNSYKYDAGTDKFYGFSIRPVTSADAQSPSTNTTPVDVNVKNTTCKQSETSAEVVISFNNYDDVMLAKSPANVSVYSYSTGGRIVTTTINETSTQGVFSITVGNIAPGSYYIIIPDNTFKSGSRPVNEMYVDFSVKDILNASNGFAKTLQAKLLTEFSKDKTYPCEDINYFGLYVTDGTLTASHKEVKLMLGGNVVRTGRLVNHDSKSLRIQYVGGDIQPKELANGTYDIVIDEITYGDANFGKYLSDASSVSASSCKVNASAKYTIIVDNEFVTVPAPSVSVKQSESNSSLTLVFSENVSLLKSSVEIKSGSTKVKDATIKAGSVQNVFIVDLGSLAAGTYSLVIPEKTLGVGNRGNKLLTAPFVIKDVLSSSNGFAKNLKVNLLTEYSNDKTYPCEDINKFGLYVSEGTLSSSKKAVKLMQGSTVVRTGKLVNQDSKTLKIQYTEGEIQPKQLVNGTYTIVIDEITYGDGNFGKYLNDISSVAASSCKVNASATYSIVVDNEYVNIKTPKVSVKQSELSSSLTLAFSESVSLIKSTVEISKNNEKVKDAGVKATSASNTFEVDLGPLSAGTYMLVIPEKTFGVGNRGNKSISATFDIQDVLNPSLGFDDTFSIIPITEFKTDSVYYCETLNDLGFYCNEEMAVSSKVVMLKLGEEIVRTGKMIATNEGQYASKIKFDEGDIEPKELANGTYVVEIEAATLGDANFGKYLSDISSVSPSECKINSAITYTINVENDFVKITDPEVALDKNEEDSIFMILTFDETQDITLTAETIDVVLNTKEGEKVKDVQISALEEAGKLMVILGQLDAGSYAFSIPEKTLSAKDSSVIERTNKQIEIVFEVSEALDIDSIFLNGNNADLIFDINGRRVSGTNHSGVYIINGKKVLVK